MTAGRPLVLLPSASEFSGPFSIVNEDGSQTAVTSLAQAAALFGEGTAMFAVARRCFPKEHIHHYPQPTDPAVLEYQRNLPRWQLASAFGAVAECIALVEAHAQALAETDASSLLTLEEWTDRAGAALGVLFDRTPELLPIGPDVHANCGDDR